MAHGRTASAKIQSVAIMHAGTIGPESARNMPPAKNHLASPNNKPHAILLAHGMGQHVFAKMVVNGIQKLECVTHHHFTIDTPATGTQFNPGSRNQVKR